MLSKQTLNDILTLISIYSPNTDHVHEDCACQAMMRIVSEVKDELELMETMETMADRARESE